MKNPDGSTTSTTTNSATGTVTETTRRPDGSKLVVETKKDGTVTSTETAKDGSTVKTVERPGGVVETTVNQAGGLTASATVADNLLMACYFFVLIAFAGMRFFRARFPHPHIDEVERGSSSGEQAKTQAAAFWSRKDISLKDVAMNIAFAVVVVWVSNLVAGLFSPLAAEGVVSTFQEGLRDFAGKFLGSQYVWITTISVLFATVCSGTAEKMHGSQEIGTYLIYLFLFVIGVPANIYTVLTEAPLFLALTFLMVVVNMLFCFAGARLLKFDLEDAIIASNANIGGPTTAAGMAISQGWSRLVGPAMLVGTLGYVLGTYAGTMVGIALGA